MRFVKIKVFALTGLFFVVLGAASLIHPRFVLPLKTDISNNGSQRVIVQTSRVIRVPLAVGIVWLLAGAALAYFSTKEPPQNARRRL